LCGEPSTKRDLESKWAQVGWVHSVLLYNTNAYGQSHHIPEEYRRAGLVHESQHLKPVPARSFSVTPFQNYALAAPRWRDPWEAGSWHVFEAYVDQTEWMACRESRAVVAGMIKHQEEGLAIKLPEAYSERDP
jgi:hypothetical protein